MAGPQATPAFLLAGGLPHSKKRDPHHVADSAPTEGWGLPLVKGTTWVTAVGGGPNTSRITGFRPRRVLRFLTPAMHQNHQWRFSFYRSSLGQLQTHGIRISGEVEAGRTVCKALKVVLMLSTPVIKSHKWAQIAHLIERETVPGMG